MRPALACIFATGVVIAGCGGSSAGVPLAAQDSATLHKDIGAIRTAAGASDPVAAHAAAARLRADVERLRGEGRLSPGDSQTILSAVSLVDNRISAQVRAATPAVTTTSPPAPAPEATPPPPAQPKEHHAPPADHRAPNKPHDHRGGKDGGG
jgi:hypothetical protein